MTKLKAYHQRTLFDTYQTAIQIREAIDRLLANNKNVGVTQLPDSSIPTSDLYLLVLCYEAIFDICVENELLKEGNIKPIGTIQ
jgi:hypothetical protein